MSSVSKESALYKDGKMRLVSQNYHTGNIYLYVSPYIQPTIFWRGVYVCVVMEYKNEQNVVSALQRHIVSPVPFVHGWSLYKPNSGLRKYHLVTQHHSGIRASSLLLNFSTKQWCEYLEIIQSLHSCKNLMREKAPPTQIVSTVTNSKYSICVN